MPSSLTTFGLPPLAGEMSEGQRGNAPNPRRSGGSRNPDGRGAGEFDRSRFGRTHPLSGRRLPASSCGGGYSTSEGHEPSDDGGGSSKRFPEGRRSGDVGGAGTKNTYQPRQSMRVVDRAKPETRRCFENTILPFAQRGGREQAERARRGCPYPDTGPESRRAHPLQLNAPK